jgi:hypothetical protein
VDGLADAVLVVHVVFVTFVVGGLGFIWTGGWLGWRAARNAHFRALHLAAIVFVVAETLIGATCPLTILESSLRGNSHDAGFIAYWLRRMLYYDLPGWVFLAAYLLFALAVAFTYILIPPHRKRRQRSHATTATGR